MIQPHHRHIINRANELVARQCIERTTMAGQELESMAQELAFVCTELLQMIERRASYQSELDGRRTPRMQSSGCADLDRAIVDIVDKRAPVCRDLIAVVIRLSEDPGVRTAIDTSICGSQRLSALNRNDAVKEIVRRRMDFLSKQGVLEHIRMPMRETGWYTCESTEIAAQ